MKIKQFKILTFSLSFWLLANSLSAQETIYYSGETLSNVDYHHGQLPIAKGVHNIQVMRANRELPDEAENFGWTYNHAPNVAYWNNTFYLEYLSDSVGEHIPPSQTLLLTSSDGYNWEKPIVAFPPYMIPDGTTKEGEDGVTRGLFAVMHQRMGFYVASDNRLLMLGYYGICMHKKDGPNDGNGIGRVVREIYSDGKMGPVYFIRYNKQWNKKNTSYPFYSKSKDRGFVKVCDELMANPLMMQQWNEEQDRDDPIIPVTKEYKAFCYYHLPDNNVVGLWKHALSSISTDQGKTWPAPVRAPGFVTKNAKIWGQKTSDGKFITVYNPSEFRWPLALSVSDDGLNYKNLLLVNGEISTMRYGGNYKSYGPQYVRGIIEGNGATKDDNAWVTYSMNKEDIWISKIPVPVLDKEINPVNDIFTNLPDGKELNNWNIFSPVWAPVSITKQNNEKFLELKDKDPYDYAKADRLVPESKQLKAEFTVTPGQNNFGLLHIEFQDNKGTATIRLIFDKDGYFKVKSGYRNSNMLEYEANTEYKITIELDTDTRFYTINVNNKSKKQIFFAPVHSVSRITFRTGEVRRFPNADTPTDQNFDVKDGGIPVQEAKYLIKYLKTY